MEYQEAYQGRRVVVRTAQGAEGTWTHQVEFCDEGVNTPVADLAQQTYASEEEARGAGLSAAAAAIDRARAGQGKP
jgi:hypothetical protein